MGLALGFGIGINYGTDQGDNTPVPPVGSSSILLETGDVLLIETGDELLLE